MCPALPRRRELCGRELEGSRHVPVVLLQSGNFEEWAGLHVFRSRSVISFIDNDEKDDDCDDDDLTMTMTLAMTTITTTAVITITMKVAIMTTMMKMTNRRRRKWRRRWLIVLARVNSNCFQCCFMLKSLVFRWFLWDLSCWIQIRWVPDCNWWTTLGKHQNPRWSDANSDNIIAVSISHRELNFCHTCFV